jgi:hypothetical protein
MRVRCDCDARANPKNEHCIIYESVSNCDCAAMKIAALAHRNRSARASQSQLEIKLYRFL